jgi:hypothetical protein
MRSGLVVVALAMLVAAAAGQAAPLEPLRIELNALETAAEGRCRASFVIENKAQTALDSLRLDIAFFNRNGIVKRILSTEMGPLRAAKTVVKAFAVEDPCDDIGSILVNDVTACAPGEAAQCLDRLTLSSRIEKVRFYK